MLTSYINRSKANESNWISCQTIKNRDSLEPSNPSSPSTLLDFCKFMRKLDHNHAVSIFNTNVANHVLYDVGSIIGSNFYNIYSKLNSSDNNNGRDSLPWPYPVFGGLECITNQQQFVNFHVGYHSELQHMVACCQLTPYEIHFQLMQRQ